jgi:hypothetical protein
MATRAMNNREKQNAAILKQKGFDVFFQYAGPRGGDYWAHHPKLICQYHVDTCAHLAIRDFDALQKTPEQIKLIF